MFKKITTGLLIFTCIAFIVCSTAKNEETVKTWKIPIYMTENLQNMVDNFNREFQAKVDFYKNELRVQFKDYTNMPEDVIMDLKNGLFIDRADYLRLQQEAKEKAQGEIKK